MEIQSSTRNKPQLYNTQAAEFFQPYGTGADQCQRRADKQTDGNTQDQAGLVVLGGQRLDRLGELIHVKLFFLIIIVGHVLQGVCRLQPPAQAARVTIHIIAHPVQIAREVQL